MFFYRLSLRAAALNVLMLVFAASALLSLWTAYDPALSRQAILALLASVSLYFVVAYGARRENRSHWIAAIGIMIAAGLTLYFITQFKYYAYPETRGLLRRLAEMTSLLPNLGRGYVHPNGVATFLEMALPICLALAVLSRGWWRWLYNIAALLMGYAILLSASRGAWIGLTLTAIIGLVVIYGQRLSRRGIVVMLGGIAAVGTIGLIIIAARLNPQTSTVETLSSRLELYRNSLYLIRDYAFTGIGLGGTYAMVYSRYSLMIFVPYLSYAHNLPLAVWFGQGLPGITAFLGIIILFYSFVYRVIRQAMPGALFYGAWLGVTATLLHGLDDARQYAESPWVMPALFFGIGLAMTCGAQALKPAESDMREHSWRTTRMVVGIIGLLVVGVFLAGGNTMRAMWDTNMGALDEARADKFIAPELDEAERSRLENSAQGWYEQALAIDSDLPSANRRLGNLLVNNEQFEEAIPLLEKAASFETSNPAAIKGLGLAYVWAGRIQAAADTLKQLDNWHDAAFELTNWHQYRTEQGQHLLAAYALETALVMRGDSQPNIGAWLVLADDYQAANEREQARKWYERVLEQDAANQQALDGLAALGE